jgi:hypothetical protein
MQKLLSSWAILIIISSSASCNHQDKRAATSVSQPAKVEQQENPNWEPNYVKRDISDYINELPDTSQFLPTQGWAVIPQHYTDTDSINATLVENNAKVMLLDYNIVYPVFKWSPVLPSNGLFKAWYTERLAHDSLDTPSLRTWLRRTRQLQKHRQQQAVDYYQILPFKHTVYIAPGGEVFVSSSATFTFGVGSGNLSGFLSHTVRVTSPASDFAQEFDATLRYQGWPKIDKVLREHGGSTLRALSDSSGIQRHLFFAKAGFIIGFENLMNSEDSFLVEVPYPLFNKQFRL